MYAKFDTLTEYTNKNQEVNAFRGYPDGKGTDRYAADTPTPTIDGKYAMPVVDSVAHLFQGCTIVETVEYATTLHGYEYITDRDELKAWITDNGLAEYFDLRSSLKSLKTALDEYYGV